MNVLSKMVAALAIGGVAMLTLSVNSTAAPGQKKAPAGNKALIAAGAKVYAANGCAACHKIAGKGGAVSTDLSKIGKTMKPAALGSVVRKGAKSKTGVVMAAYGADKINDKDLKALVAYMSSLK